MTRTRQLSKQTKTATAVNMIKRQSAKKIAAITAASVAAIAAITGAGYYRNNLLKDNNKLKKILNDRNDLLLKQIEWDNSTYLNRLRTPRPR